MGVSQPTILYRRVLLKLSGEALSTADPQSDCHPTLKTSTINTRILSRIVKDISKAVEHHVQLGVVVGGGNWFRGVDGASVGLLRTTADHIGMLATVMNALVLRDALIEQNIETRIMSAIPIGGVVEGFDRGRAHRYLKKNYVVIFAGGTGNPFVSTDAAASLRALEIEADILLKATSVDGIYSEDPIKNPHATRYERLSYQEVLHAELGVMDLASFCQCRDYKMPIRVFNINTPDALWKIVTGQAIGTLVH